MSVLCVIICIYYIEYQHFNLYFKMFIDNYSIIEAKSNLVSVLTFSHIFKVQLYSVFSLIIRLKNLNHFTLLHSLIVLIF